MTLSAKGLRILRSGTTVLDEAACSLERGQITAICGPNGAGKSTLLMALAGLLEPSAGTIELAGEPIDAMTPRDRAKRMGYLHQSHEIAWDVAVENLVRLGRLPHRDRGQEAVNAAIAALDLEALRHRPVGQLSGGERARALLARVLAGEPDWILADEPLAALDLAHQLALLRHLRAACDDGRGGVLVLHDLAHAMNHADHVLVLDQGRLVAAGSPQEALTTTTIQQVWGVDARWTGEDGHQALIVEGRAAP